jgi:NodT family efflux transporter outer membrane factor (OMF) lipoprotein
MKPMAHPRIVLPAVILALAGGCAVGPDYKRPAAEIPVAFKETPGWKEAVPADSAARGPWWEALGDPVLSELEGRVASANQSLRQAAATYEEARQAARADHATYFPDLSAVGSAYRTHPVPAGGSQPATSNAFSASLEASWAPDFWGRIRRQAEADVNAAQASAANLASARLATQVLLAQDYIALRAVDEKKRLLDNAVESYGRTLKITQNKYAVGVSARSDVISAEALLDSARAQAIDVGVQRAQLEHAIAVLVGRPPSEFSIAPQPRFLLGVPSLAPQLPSSLLERRPDIAAAERTVGEANAKVGVQTAAYFPDITLSAAGGYEGSPLDRLFTAPFRMWSLGSNVSESLLDFGQRRADLLEARAAYDAAVAGYRQTVLAAFEQVEDNLASLRILEQEAQVQDSAVKEASAAARIAENEYKAGTVDYTYVVTSQVNEVNDKVSALTILQSRLTDSVALIGALGGGWRESDLPTAHEVFQRHAADGAAVAAPK